MEAVRGETDLYKPASHTTSYLRAGEVVCQEIADGLVSRTGVFSRNPTDVNESLDNMVRHIMGLDNTHPRAAKARQVVRQIYQRGIELNLSEGASLKEVFVFVCTSPDVLGVGL